MGIGEERNGLYYLDPTRFCFNFADSNKLFSSSCKSFNSVVHKTRINNTKDLNWHQRLGHPSLFRMHMLPFISKTFTLLHCHICPQSKQTRLPFPSQSTSVSDPFQIIHMDIWGTFHIATRNGEKYFLTIVDEYTKSTWIYLMQSWMFYK